MSTAWRPVGLAIVAALALVLAIRPTAREPFRPYGDLPELSAASRTASGDADLLTGITARADAREEARRLPPGRPGDAIFRFEAPLTPAAAARIEKSLREELAVVAPQGTAHPIVVIVRVDSIALGGSYRRIVVLPEAPDAPCVVVFGVSPQNLRYPEVFATDRLLGTCGFYAALGAPGRGVAQWLRETNLELASHYQRPAALGDGIEPIAVGTLANAPLRALASCAAGRDGACTKVLESPRVPWDEIWLWRRPSQALYESAPGAVPGVATYSQYGGTMESNWLRAGMLSDLARELGEERFVAIWRDDRAPADAYEAREGRAYDDWMRERVLARVEPYQPGPWIAGVPLALALALIGASGYAGIRFAKREMS